MLYIVCMYTMQKQYSHRSFYLQCHIFSPPMKYTGTMHHFLTAAWLTQLFSTNHPSGATVSMNLSKIKKVAEHCRGSWLDLCLRAKGKAGGDTQSGHRVRNSLYKTKKCNRDMVIVPERDVWDGNRDWKCAVFVLWHQMASSLRPTLGVKTRDGWSVKGIRDSRLSLPHPNVSHNSNHPLTQSWESLSWWIRLLQHIFGSALSSG